MGFRANRSLNNLHYNRDELLKTVRENRDKHVQTHEASMRVYRQEMVRVLGELLESAERNEDVEHNIQLERPQTFVQQYDRVIAMLTRCSEEEVELDSEGFDQIVLDQWEWSDTFTFSNSSYGH